MCMRTSEENGIANEGIQFFSDRFEPPRETLKSGKSKWLVHCSVQNAAVLHKNHCKRVMQF